NRAEKKRHFKKQWINQCFGITRQALHKKIAALKKKQSQDKQLVQMVLDKRAEISQSTGIRKLHQLLQEEFAENNIKIGRDKLFDFARAHALLVPKLRAFHITTNSKHNFKKFKNLVKNKVPNRPEELWVSDITYLRLNGKHAYLALITDAY